jgi:clan AA aspartic protease
MGIVYAEIELINGMDLGMARRHLIGEEEIKHIRVNMLVDSGSVNMCINEHIREILQLPIVDKREWQLANGQMVEYEVAGPIEVRFENRRCNVDAFVLPGDNEPLLGAIPMEDMDALIHPKRQELVLNPKHLDGVYRRL